MAFTRDRIQTIISNETLTPGEKVDQIFAMHGQTLSDYVSKADAEKMKEDAVKAVKIPDPKESEAYKTLDAEYSAYKAKQSARLSDDYKGVKAKFFDQVYDSIQRGEGAKPITEQMAELKKNYSEYFETEEEEKKLPTFGSPTEGEMPKGGQKSFDSYWGFTKNKKE